MSSRNRSRSPTNYKPNNNQMYDRDRRYDDRDRRYDDRDRNRRYDDRDRDRRYDDRDRDRDRRYDDRDRDRRYDDGDRDKDRDRRYDDRNRRYDDRRPNDAVVGNFKIAFLFLVRDDLHFPDIWENYFRGHENKFTIYCHPKNPENVNTPWLKSNIIPKLVPTEWGRITDAYFTLINEALKNEENQKFITISESCLPLKSFNDLYHFFSSSDMRTSYIRFWNVKDYDIDARLKAKYIDEIDPSESNQQFIKEQSGRNTVVYFKNIRNQSIQVIKHYARYCLSRYHALKLLNYSDGQPIPSEYIHNEDLDRFNSMSVGDEFFLSILNPKQGRDYISDYEMIFDNWNRVKKEREKVYINIESIDAQIVDINRQIKSIPASQMVKNLKEIGQLKKNISQLEANKSEIRNLLETKFSNANPYTYHEVTPTDVREGLRTNSFFWRKFAPDSNVIEYYDVGGIPRRIGGTNKRHKQSKKYNKKCNKCNKNKKTNKKKTT